MEPKNRRGFFLFIGQCIAAAFAAPSVLPKVVEAIEPTIKMNGVDLSDYVKPADFDSLPLPSGREWFIDPINGDDANDGLSWDRPMRGIPSNLYGDTVYFKGYYTATVKS